MTDASPIAIATGTRRHISATNRTVSSSDIMTWC